MGKKRAVGGSGMARAAPLVVAAAVTVLVLFLGMDLPGSPSRAARLDSGGLSNVRGSIDASAAYDVCTVGAGLSGTVLAERFASVLGKKVLVMDKRNHFGGNCYDYRDRETGILMNKYGAHLFHTSDERAWRYVTMHEGAPPWVRWDHEVKGWVRGRLVNIPVNINTVNRLFDLSIRDEAEMAEWLRGVQEPCGPSGCEDAEQMAKSRVGADLFDAIFRAYTIKQWAKEPRDLDALVTARIPVRASFDPRYFSDKYQALPSEGYTAWFASLLDHPNIDVALGVDYFAHQAHLRRACGLTIYTGPIDRYFAARGLAQLEYRGIDFVVEKYHNVGGFMQPASVVNYPGPEVNFTRIVEYKHFLLQQSPHTVLVKEFSKEMGPDDDPYYPVPNKRNLALYEIYKGLAEDEERKENIVFVGRLANYKYFNMDETIVNALEIFWRIAGRPQMPDMPGLFGAPAASPG